MKILIHNLTNQMQSFGYAHPKDPKSRVLTLDPGSMTELPVELDQTMFDALMSAHERYGFRELIGAGMGPGVYYTVLEETPAEPAPTVEAEPAPVVAQEPALTDSAPIVSVSTEGAQS